MIPVQPDYMPQPFANGGEKNVIPNSGGEVLGNASYSSGFPRITETPIELGGVPPQRKDFNGILNAVSSFNFFQQSGGVFAYSNTINYVPGCVVRYSNTEFVCITENGVDSVNGVHSPEESSYWKKHTPPFVGINSTGITEINFDGDGATGTDAIAIGKGTIASAPSSVALGSGAMADSSLVVSVGNGNQNRKVVNMADGTDEKDAVNVSQLNEATTPIGTIIMWASSTNPQDGGVWLDCNGQSCTSYPKLVAIVGNNVPDLQGLFPRCVGSQTVAETTYSVSLGEKQGDAIRNITGWIGDISSGSSSGNVGGAFFYDGSVPQNKYNAETANISGIGFDASKVIPTASENRPAFVGLRFLIKAQ